MENYYKSQGRAKACEYSHQLTKKHQMRTRARKVQMEMAKLQTQNRQNKYFSFTQTDPTLEQYMEEGVIKLKHPDLHDFRDRIKQKEMEQNYGGIYLKTQMTSKDRGNLEEQEFRNAHLNIEEYDQYPPTKDVRNWLRVRQLSSEGPDLQFGLKERTENENIRNNIKDRQILDTTEKDMTMVHFPKWKHIQKKQWAKDDQENPKDFQIAPNPFPTWKAAWQQHPIKGEVQEKQYIDGLEAVGQIETLRHRKKNLERNRPDLNTTVREDVWNDTLKTSQSIRTFMQDKVLQLQQDFQLYSQNGQFDNLQYKKALIDTKSVDRSIPFKHSNNASCLPLQNLRPNYGEKIFKLSVKQQKIEFKREKLDNSFKFDNSIERQLNFMDDSVNSMNKYYNANSKSPLRNPQQSIEQRYTSKLDQIQQSHLEDSGVHQQQNHILEKDQQQELEETLQQQQSSTYQQQKQQQQSKFSKKPVKLGKFDQTNSVKFNKTYDTYDTDNNFSNTQYGKTQNKFVQSGSIFGKTANNNFNRMPQINSKSSYGKSFDGNSNYALYKKQKENMTQKSANMANLGTKNLLPWEHPSNQDLQHIISRYFIPQSTKNQSGNYDYNYTTQNSKYLSRNNKQ